MISFGRMFVAGLGALLVSCCTAGTAALLVLASALSGASDSCRDGGCGNNDVQLVIALILVAVAGIALSAGTIRVLLGRRGRGIAKLLVVSGGVLLVVTMLLLAGDLHRPRDHRWCRGAVVPAGPSRRHRVPCLLDAEHDPAGQRARATGLAAAGASDDRPYRCG